MRPDYGIFHDYSRRAIYDRTALACSARGIPPPAFPIKDADVYYYAALGIPMDWIVRGDANACDDNLKYHINETVPRSPTSVARVTRWAEDADFRMLKINFSSDKRIRTIRHRYEVTGRTRWEFADEDANAPHWKLYRENCWKGLSMYDFRYSFAKRSGNRHYISLNATPIIRDGRLRGVSGTARRLFTPCAPGLYGETRKAA